MSIIFIPGTKMLPYKGICDVEKVNPQYILENIHRQN